MIIVYFFILIIYIFIYAKAKKTFPKKDNTHTSFFSYIAIYVYHKYPSHFLSKRVKDELRNIEPTEKPAEMEKKYYLEKVTLFVGLSFAGVLLAFLISAAGLAGGCLEEGMRIARNTYGGGSKSTTLIALLNQKSIEVPVLVEERKYTDSELEKEYRPYLAELEKAVLDPNSSSDHITKNLNFAMRLDGYPFLNEWESSDYTLVDSSGNLGERVPAKGGELVKITVTIRYFDWKKEYSFYLKIFEKELIWEEKTQKMLKEMIGKEQEKSKSDAYLNLPTTLGKEKFSWKEKKENSSFIIFLFGLLAAIGMFFVKDREIYQKSQKRKEEMLSDYPEIISKITLLTGAGMALRQTLEKIAIEYTEKKKEGQKRRYAYEEIMLTFYEMESGISEMRAYENFGKRCKVQVYMKLGSLLAQNSKKGNSGLLKMLRKEAEDAFEERKNSARKKGEEAGTKLLLPMMIMLSIVMIVIIVPAFLSFQL